MSEHHRRRILRRGDAVVSPSAGFLVDVPSGPGAGTVANGLPAMLEEARREGREEGYRAATEELGAAQAAGRAAQLRRVADALVTAAADIRERRSQVVEMGAAEAAELAYALAEAFLQRELSIGRPAVEAVTRALQLVPDEHDLIVRIHPGEAVSQSELQEMVPDAGVKVVEDPRIEPGGCVVTAGPCRIDTQIGSALERARQVLAELYGSDSPAPVPSRLSPALSEALA